MGDEGAVLIGWCNLHGVVEDGGGGCPSEEDYGIYTMRCREPLRRIILDPQGEEGRDAGS